jgi:hypothetical protein
MAMLCGVERYGRRIHILTHYVVPGVGWQADRHLVISTDASAEHGGVARSCDSPEEAGEIADELNDQCGSDLSDIPDDLQALLNRID